MSTLDSGSVVVWVCLMLQMIGLYVDDDLESSEVVLWAFSSR